MYFWFIWDMVDDSDFDEDKTMKWSWEINNENTHTRTTTTNRVRKQQQRQWNTDTAMNMLKERCVYAMHTSYEASNLSAGEKWALVIFRWESNEKQRRHSIPSLDTRLPILLERVIQAHSYYNHTQTHNDLWMRQKKGQARIYFDKHSVYWTASLTILCFSTVSSSVFHSRFTNSRLYVFSSYVIQCDLVCSHSINLSNTYTTHFHPASACK